MEPMTIVCNAQKPGGTWCGQPAIVHKAEYELDTGGYDSPSGIRYTLRTAVYEIECPACGRRTQVERAEHSQPQGSRS